jgi:hypothetical protein
MFVVGFCDSLSTEFNRAAITEIYEITQKVIIECRVVIRILFFMEYSISILLLFSKHNT